MSEKKIEKLTPEQEALIPVYREKWRKIAVSTEPIDREKAGEAVKKAYAVLGKKEPNIIFCDSPYVVASSAFGRLKLIRRRIDDKLWIQLKRQLDEQLQYKLDDEFCEQLWFKIIPQLKSKLHELLYEKVRFYNRILTETDGACNGSLYDFCISVINCSHQQIRWEIFQLLTENCGWIFPDENIAIVCDRPRILSFDNQQRLHAEGAPAIQFADGYSLYAYHGVTLPEKYGKIHPNNWQASWLLEEKNAELRGVLIQGIGYDRIAAELGVTQLDSFQEYTLLKIDNNVDLEPISMLKMTCPSTGYIHVLRVPPDVRSAREAIRWVNWGVDPEDFGVQT